MAARFLAPAILCSPLLAGCQCGKSAKPSSLQDPPVIPIAPTTKRPALPPELELLWTRAESEEADELARLARAEGGMGLVDGADDAHKKIAVLALAYTDDFVGLPWAADVAIDKDKDLAQASAESFVAAIVARTTHRDPEDALELAETCKKWLAVAKNAKADATVRKLAGRGLRMLVDTRCLKLEDLAGVP